MLAKQTVTKFYKITKRTNFSGGEILLHFFAEEKENWLMNHEQFITQLLAFELIYAIIIQEKEAFCQPNLPIIKYSKYLY